MKKVLALLALCIAYSLPIIARASVVINEVAWMGTSSQYEEWFELYNGGSSSVSVDGWVMYKTGGTTLITLSGSIPADGYELVCRTTGTVTNPLGGICTQTGAFGGSGMNNTSDQLVLKDNGGTTVDSVDATSGWPAGDSATKETMQKSGSGWITAAGTPGMQNIAESPDPDPEPEDDDDTPDPPTDPDPPTTHSGGNRGGKSAKGVTVKLIDPNPVYTATLVTAPDYTMRGVPTTFEAKVSKDRAWIISLVGRYEWSMGDGSSYTFRKNTPVVHTYQHPGTYTVVFRYSSNWLKDKPDSIHMKEIAVLDDSVAIAKVAGTDDIRVTNHSTQQLDLRGWVLRSPRGDTYLFPPYTLIPKKGEIIVPADIIGFRTGMDVILENPNGKQISSTIPVVQTSVSKPAGYRGTYRSSPQAKEYVAFDSSNSTEETSDPPLGAQVPGKHMSFPWPLMIGVFLAVVSGYAAYRYTGTSTAHEDEQEMDSVEHDLYDLEELLDEDE